MTEDDKYEALEKIGHGSFGVIRKVRRKADGHILCRKEISYLRMSQKEREQLQAEISILKELRHPNIVAYYEREHLKASMDLHLYMEYCGNGDLGQVIRNLKSKNQFAEEEFVWSIFAQLVTALYRCHYGENPPEVGRNMMGLGNNAKPLKSKQTQYMILHRDLKPENVFLGADNSVKLGDFGLSKILQSHDFASTYVGTPFYMSPEICAAERYTLFSDIWSLGCIIYELCAKEPPFNAKTHFDLVQKIKLGRVPTLPGVYSAELQKVINSCLRVNPNTRPDTAQLLNLPIIKLLRKEQEVVYLGQQMKAEKELAVRTLKEASDRIAKLEAERNTMKLEIEATVRREWEVKARLEIDRQIQIELETLRTRFESDVSKRVTEEVAKNIGATAPDAPKPLGTLQNSDLTGFQEELPARAQTPVKEVARQLSSLSTLGSASDFPSDTDLSSLSLESPEAEKTTGKTRPPMQRGTRTPFARAKTMFAVPAASPMDVHMADASPISIAGLSLSPRRNEIAKQQRSGRLPTKNIFQSTVPVVATSPVRRTGGNRVPGGTSDAGSAALRKAPVAPAAPARTAKGRTGVTGEGMVTPGGRNNLQGRTLVELSQGKVGDAERVMVDGDGERKNIGLVGKRAGAPATMVEREREVVWDPEQDEMPSPFLVRGTKAVRAPIGAR